MTPLNEFYFEQVDSFTISHKIYGNTLKNVDRIVNTFNQRPNSTGVMLNGEKGSGKTMMAKALSVKCAELGMPTIIINQAWVGDEFNTLIQSIEQPCVILFDESGAFRDDRARWLYTGITRAADRLTVVI